MISPFLSPITRTSSDMSTDDHREQDELNEAIKKAHEIARALKAEKEQKEIWSFWNTKVCPKCSNQLFSLILYKDRTRYECDNCCWQFTVSAVVGEQDAPALK